MEKKLKEELGSYLMDVSKYVLTAVLITMSFADMIFLQWLAYVIAIIIVAATLIWGLFYFKS